MELRIKYVRELNWSLLRAGVPLVYEFEVTGGAPATDSTIGIGLKPYIATLLLSVGNLSDDKLRLPEFQVNWDEIWKIKEAMNLHLEIEINGHHGCFPILVLAPDQWHHCIGRLDNHYCINKTLYMAEAKAAIPPGGTVTPAIQSMTWDNPPLPVGFAALVQSKLRLVEEIKNSIMARLKVSSITARLKVSSITDFDENTEPLLKALFEELRQRYPNHYHDIEPQTLEPNTQSVRLAFHNVWNEDGKGKGANCIDFVVLGAAILEACGARPGLVVIGNGNGNAHALLSCWRRSNETSRKSVLTEQVGFQKYISGPRPELLVLDLTKLTTGSSPDEALEEGQKYLKNNNTSQFLYMVDIYETR